MRETRSIFVTIFVMAWLIMLAGTGSAQEPTEYGTKTTGGLEITLLTAPP